MKIKILISTIIVAFTLGSCSDFLDVKPMGKLIPDEASDLENLLNNSNVYSYFFIDNNRGCSYAFLGDNLEMTKNVADFFYSSSSPNKDRYAAYTFYSPYIDPTGAVHYFWVWTYRAVGIFNNIIKGIEGLSDSETNYAKSIMAQAKAARAFSYLTAGIIYGPMWDPSGNNGTKVIPYRIENDPNVGNPDLSTTEELFNLVWEDLEYALKYIPDQVANPTRHNKAAVYATRALWHMYKRDWPNMLTEADNAWKAAGNNADNLIYDMNNFSYKVVGTPPSDGTDHEVTLDLQYKDATTEPFNEARGRETLYHRDVVEGTNSARYPSQEWLNLFDTNKDLRYKLFVLKNHGYKNTTAGVNDGIRLFYYRGSKTKLSGGITYPELLLMRAEAYARTNKLSDALNDLNTLRKYRYVRVSGDPENINDHPNGATLLTNQDLLIEEILKERRREQPIESYHRTVDLKRYVYDIGKAWSKTSITHYIDTQAYTKDLTDKMAFTLPIDNGTITNNPQWGLTPYTGTWKP